MNGRERKKTALLALLPSVHVCLSGEDINIGLRVFVPWFANIILSLTVTGDNGGE